VAASPDCRAVAELLLELRNLRKSFGGLVVTDDVSLDLRQGEIHALIGPNGAGKTTLIHQISGTLAPDSGQVIFAGEEVTRLSLARRARRGLARSFQITSIVPGFSAIENVALAVQARSGSSFRFFRPVGTEAGLNEQAMEALTEVGLEHRAAAPAAVLSHGEKRQLELAIALAMQPRLLLLDEPLAGLSQDERVIVRDLVAAIPRDTTIVMIEHDMDVALAFAEQISVLHYGQLIVEGDRDTVVSHPRTREVYLGG
jgi:branched-chain amino acid transport system ATP-binding protein